MPAPLLVSLALLLAVAGPAAADSRCGIALQTNVCLGANPVCPDAGMAVGLAAGSWPAHQRDAQHTGATDQLGPTCGKLAWTTKLNGRIFGAAALAEPRPGEPELLFLPVGKFPVCALDPATGVVAWCGTDNLGKQVDRSSPVIGNGQFLYVGTRDNDLWAIDLPVGPPAKGSVAWRQKVCTDGDVTMPPAIGPDGTVFMGSDSLGGGTIMAMCPGSEQQVKWCRNPVGGGIRNTSPALSPSGHRVYYVIGKTILAAYDPQTGEEMWRIRLEPSRGSVGRTPNYSPVVDPVTGRIFLGLDTGLWAVDVSVDPQTGEERPIAHLFFGTGGVREKMYSPPVVDRARGRVVFGASRGVRSSLYAVGLDGALQWRRELPRGRFRNNPPVVDGAGRIYLTMSKEILGFTPAGGIAWRVASPSPFFASPIVAGGRTYVASVNGMVYAVGDCPP